MRLEQTPLVVVFTTAYLPFIGGAEIAIDEITKRVNSMRFLIITSRGSRKNLALEHDGARTIVRVGIGSRFDKWLLPFLGAYAVWRHARHEKQVVLWGMMISQGSIAALFYKITHLKIPFVVTLQEGDAETYLDHGRLGLIKFFWKWILRRADGVTAISVYLADRAQALGSRHNITIIPNGVDEQFVSASYERVPVEIYKEELGIPRADRVIITVSRLAQKNGLHDLLGAISIVHKKMPVTLIVLGEGEEKSALAHLAGKIGVAKYVLFLGSRPHSEIEKYYRMSDVFVRPSRSEGLGIAFLEAMGAGIPVVATPVGGIVDFLEDGVTGIFVEPKNPKSIAYGILKVLEDEGLARALKENARELMIQKYLWVDIAHQMEGFFLTHLA
jgi:glycosyltransferase involved in cell wall biosynthesis